MYVYTVPESAWCLSEHLRTSEEGMRHSTGTRSFISLAHSSSLIPYCFLKEDKEDFFIGNGEVEKMASLSILTTYPSWLSALILVSPPLHAGELRHT